MCSDSTSTRTLLVTASEYEPRCGASSLNSGMDSDFNDTSVSGRDRPGRTVKERLTIERCTTIRAARLKPGAAVDDLSRAAGAEPASAGRSGIIRGKALIFWDLKVPGKRKKLDAIDTDQITPAADCVSESLDTLDERWKAGSFRYLMPDFRARVHRGETFLIAGDRFAIGSSREMSPAGLKGVAEEVGLQMVVVCGNNMGDIFRRNALNLGLQVVQSAGGGGRRARRRRAQLRSGDAAPDE